MSIDCCSQTGTTLHVGAWSNLSVQETAGLILYKMYISLYDLRRPCLGVYSEAVLRAMELIGAQGLHMHKQLSPVRCSLT